MRKPFSPEAKERLRQSTLRSWADPESRARRLAGLRVARVRAANSNRRKYTQLHIAVQLTAAYQCGYRDATGDRALALAAQQAEARRQADTMRAEAHEFDQRRRLLGSAAA